MKQPNIHTISLLLAVVIMVNPLSLHAEDLIDQTSNVFNFQQKLANKGNVGAQYKLATMYETGEGVSVSLEQAKHWYSRAGAAGSKAARQRNIYLNTKEQGYDRATGAAWLNSVKVDASEHKVEAILLLGQLYGEGLGVEKDLNKSLELLKQVQVLGAADVESQIAAVQDEIDRSENRAQNSKKSRELENANLQLANEQQRKQQAEAKRLLQQDKVRRYEKAMQKLQYEQATIDEQQAWASGGDTSAIADDEI